MRCQRLAMTWEGMWQRENKKRTSEYWGLTAFLIAANDFDYIRVGVQTECTNNIGSSIRIAYCTGFWSTNIDNGLFSMGVDYVKKGARLRKCDRGIRLSDLSDRLW